MERPMQANSTCWFVGATFSGTQDQTQRFLENGIWENGCTSKYLEYVKAMKVGDRIAIKSSYTRKKNLPFDNRGRSVSVMAIKAIGVVTGNEGDGHHVSVRWTQVNPVREWYFYTNRMTVWRLMPGDPYNDALIAFAFEGKPQDTGWIKNQPYWRERYGDGAEGDARFQWTSFYESLADALLSFKEKRGELIKILHDISKRVDGISILNDQYKDGTTGLMRDICPFTAIGAFNRGITDENRKKIAAELASALKVDAALPVSFEGIPVVNNQKSWFYAYEKDRKPGDIDALWEVFERAVRYADSDEGGIDEKEAFMTAYDAAAGVLGVGWNLTMGLYWVRPWNFISLDSRSRTYIDQKLGLKIGKGGLKKQSSAEEYLGLAELLDSRFKEDAYPVHSFPELSLAAWKYSGGGEDGIRESAAETGADDAEPEADYTAPVAPIQTYTVDDVIADGSFVERGVLEAMVDALHEKQNIILQGPPGTGKTWLAKRLAYALLGKKDEKRVRLVQFHANLGYEDFVRGYRPNGEGRLDLVDGPFMEMARAAFDDAKEKYVVVIEEINRGNPAHVFGEMLTLLEADKRTPEEALELCYRKYVGERVSLPKNLYVIGTMNLADRSLALVDMAFRRRFSFFDLEPEFGDIWSASVSGKNKIDRSFLIKIGSRIGNLNDIIAQDKTLGPQYRIGHSRFTPSGNEIIREPQSWYIKIIQHDIGPLLTEYWFDDADKVKKAKESLLEGI